MRRSDHVANCAGRVVEAAETTASLSVRRVFFSLFVFIRPVLVCLLLLDALPNPFK